MKSKPQIKYDYLGAEWEVRYQGRTYFSTKSWSEAMDYAMVLARFMKDSTRIY